MADSQQVLSWVCQNQSWLGPAVAVVLPASIISGWADKLPTPIKHVVNALGLNWGDIVRSVVLTLESSGVAKAAAGAADQNANPAVNPPPVQ